MERKAANTAAGTAISQQGSPVSQRVLVRYQFSLAVLDTMLHNGDLSEQEYHTAGAVLAVHYGLDNNSIFR